jgi:hypothetical protein
MATNKLDRLRDKKKIIAEQIRREENRLNAKKRKDETRRKILAGAAVLSEAEARADFKTFLFKLLDRFLTKQDDRALFNLPPRLSLTQPLAKNEDEPEERDAERA